MISRRVKSRSTAISFNTKSTTGTAGEGAVVDWLKAHGYTIVQRNYRKRFGEIDIIACREQVLCFVEVKTRTSRTFLFSELISPFKKKKICHVAQEFVSTHDYHSFVWRFDVALVHVDHAGCFVVDYFPHAFTQQDVQGV